MITYNAYRKVLYLYIEGSEIEITTSLRSSAPHKTLIITTPEGKIKVEEFDDGIKAIEQI